MRDEKDFFFSLIINYFDKKYRKFFIENKYIFYILFIKNLRIKVNTYKYVYFFEIFIS